PGTAIPHGSVFTATIYYHGTPLSGSGFFTHGLVHSVLPTGTNITFSLSDPFLAKDWWACKQDLNDKIDSADLWFTVADSLKAGSNGGLRQVVSLGNGTTQYRWHTNYPIDYYLISASVAPYVVHEQILTFGGSSDQMPIQHFVYDTASFYPLYKAALDSTPFMVDYLSSVYGRYPFWKEKYGHCTAPLGGGMEHQTMTTLGAYETPLIAHELGHQWWGDCVTFSSWRDVWLSEGFASFTELLYVEHFWGKVAAKLRRTGVFNRSMASVRGSVYVDDTSDVYRVFSSRLTYDKGAAVVHMLRYLAPNDSTFFAALRNYQQQYAYKTANSAQFQQVINATYGRNLDTFFMQWLYGEGYPIYSASWNQVGNRVFIKLDQSGSYPASVPVFSLPVPLGLHANGADTTVIAQFNTSSKVFEFDWAPRMTDLYIDPNNDIVNAAGLIFQDPGLSIEGQAATILHIAPNPSKGIWTISGLSGNNSIRLFDALGKEVVVTQASNSTFVLEAGQLPIGIYTLLIQPVTGGSIATFSLMKN
ncbi:MAG: T9SS type A sorting domain-containing protein, partial [Bacteroidetes bacterium]|nr:T9SS type A sorting domain-containing protein [Bacteroidota bacterium]